ncbi:unnamed protein product [Trichobilharzia regenti]|nr:unnamed protein product [Trichobilharzia regenti]
MESSQFTYWSCWLHSIEYFKTVYMRKRFIIS